MSNINRDVIEIIECSAKKLGARVIWPKEEKYLFKVTLSDIEAACSLVDGLREILLKSRIAIFQLEPRCTRVTRKEMSEFFRKNGSFPIQPIFNDIVGVCLERVKIDHIPRWLGLSPCDLLDKVLRDFSSGGDFGYSMISRDLISGRFFGSRLDDASIIDAMISVSKECYGWNMPISEARRYLKKSAFYFGMP